MPSNGPPPIKRDTSWPVSPPPPPSKHISNSDISDYESDTTSDDISQYFWIGAILGLW